MDLGLRGFVASSEPSVRLVDFLRDCIELETRIGDLYERYASLWSSDPRVARFWAEMSFEERVHAAVLAACKRALEDNDRQEPIDRAGWAAVRGFVRALTTWAEPRSLDEALDTALNLEELELGRIHGEILRLSGLTSEGAGIARDPSDERHVESLLTAIERHGRDVRLRQRAEAHRANRAGDDRPATISAALRTTCRRVVGDRAPTRALLSSHAAR